MVLNFSFSKFVVFNMGFICTSLLVLVRLFMREENGMMKRINDFRFMSRGPSRLSYLLNISIMRYFMI